MTGAGNALMASVLTGTRRAGNALPTHHLPRGVWFRISFAQAFTGIGVRPPINDAEFRWRAIEPGGTDHRYPVANVSQAKFS
jgi:hypothetical protein